MYREVYIDVVFAANFLMDYILLSLVGIFMRLQRSRRRCLMAAATGAFFSALSLCIPMMDVPAVSILLTIMCAAGMVFLSYGIRRGMIKALLFFFCMAFLTGGIWDLIVGNRNTSGRIFLLCAAGTYGGLTVCLHVLEYTAGLRQNRYPVILSYKGKKLRTCGFYDTGNLLMDPYSGVPVSIVSPDILSGIFSDISLEKLRNMMENPGELESTEMADLKPRFLLFRTVGQGERMILAVTLDDLCIQTPQEVVHIADPVLALSQDPFALGKEYKVLLNSRLLH